MDTVIILLIILVVLAFLLSQAALVFSILAWTKATRANPQMYVVPEDEPLPNTPPLRPQTWEENEQALRELMS